MSQTRRFRYQYRPRSYFEPLDGATAILRNIKGERRRKAALRLLESGRYGEIPDLLLETELSETDRSMLEQLHPTWMGGEYLPPYLPNEVEIARVALQTTTCDVYAVRARPAKGGRIRYRVVDEYETEFFLSGDESDEPLTLRELINLIDSAEDNANGFGFYRGLVFAIADCAVYEGGEDPSEYANFAEVSSVFYPQLGAYYEREAERWLRKAASYYRRTHRE